MGQRMGSGRLAMELALIMAVAPAACGFSVVTAVLDGAPVRKAQPRYRRRPQCMSAARTGTAALAAIATLPVQL